MRSISPSDPAANDPSQPLEGWVGALLSIAADHATGLPLTELLALLPNDDFEDEAQLRAWLTQRPQLARIEEGWAFAVGRDLHPTPDRLERAHRHEAGGQALLRGPLRPVLGWLRCVGITGSTAYGTPTVEDDLDFLLIAEDGRLWLALLRIYLGLRRREGTQGLPPLPRLCFNYARDDSTVRREFAEARDPLFAREALSVRILYAPEYYAGLVRSGSWMADQFPQLFLRWKGLPRSTVPPARRASPLVRALNAVAFFALATYFQLAGLVRNARLRRAGRADAGFRTVTTLGGLSFDSFKFERIRSRYTRPIPSLPSRAASALGLDGAGAHPTARDPPPRLRATAVPPIDRGEDPTPSLSSESSKPV